MPSRVLGRYAMYEQFAAGGMATLHYGRLLGPAGFSRTVAIKRLHAHLSEDPDFVAMFVDEARLAARVHHPNVIQTLDVESSEGELFVVLDYVHGDSLSRILREARRLGEQPTPAIVGTILFGSLEGLHAAHEALDAKGEPLEIVHRDVSPHNLLVGTDGIARVLDFGVAKARGRAQATGVGQLKGKLAYMAPEQLRGKVTRRTDVFAASVVLWEALTGTRLFKGDDEGEILDKLLLQEIPSPRQYSPDVSPELEEVVMRGLEREPSRRFATAREMAIALEQHVTLATPIEVGAFVARIGGTTLAQRAERVAEIEVESSGGVDTDAEEHTPAEVAHRPRAASVTGATAATVAFPGLALEGDRTTVDKAELTGTGVATVSEASGPGRRRRANVVRAAWVAGAAAVLGLTLLARAGAEHAPAPSASAETSPPQAASPPAPAAPAPVAAASATDSVAPADPPRAQTPPDVPHRRAVAAPTRPRSGCATPYTIDARGVRHYKPECI
jgi:serine/threonine-protein kinase